MTRDEFIQRAIAVHGSKYSYTLVDYVNIKTKVKIICPDHGVFEQTPDKHIHGKCGCPQCAGNVRLTTDLFIQKARAVHGDKYDYSLVVYKNNRELMPIICPEHGVFYQSALNHLAGKGCSLCANNVLLTTEAFIQKAKVVHGDVYDYSEVDYHGNRKPIKIVCSVHGGFYQIPYAHLSGSGCPLCGRENQSLHRDAHAIFDKTKATWLDKYGVDNVMKNDDVRNRHLESVRSIAVNEKRVATKRLNGSFNTSLSEYRLQKILNYLNLCPSINMLWKSPSLQRLRHNSVQTHLRMSLWQIRSQFLAQNWKSPMPAYLQPMQPFQIQASVLIHCRKNPP